MQIPANAAVRLTAIAVAIVAMGGCAEQPVDDGFVRGPGLRIVQLPVVARVAIYDAALRSAFDVGPDLILMVDPRYLPRTKGLGVGPPVPKALITAMRERGIVQGTCMPPAEGAREAPMCEAANAGYIVRFSEVFRLAADSVQVHVAVERFNTSTSAKSEIMRFERAFQVVGQGTRWRVARSGRFGLAVPSVGPLRGD